MSLIFSYKRCFLDQDLFVVSEMNLCEAMSLLGFLLCSFEALSKNMSWFDNSCRSGMVVDIVIQLMTAIQ